MQAPSKVPVKSLSLGALAIGRELEAALLAKRTGATASPPIVPVTHNVIMKSRNTDHYRPQSHITPAAGRLNDPNGMLLYDGRLHVFFQHDPSFPAQPKRIGWGHASTAFDYESSVQHDEAGEAPHAWDGTWQHHPDALYPDHSYDLHGCYSGGASFDADGNPVLFYTGNLKVDDAGQPDTAGSNRRPSQNIVRVTDINGAHGGFYRREAKNPIIPEPPAGIGGDFRDPMVTKNPARPGWMRMVIGAAREADNQTPDAEEHKSIPAVALYASDDPYLAQWDYQGLLDFDLSQAQPGGAPDLIPGGYMWECPNLLTLRDSATGEHYDVLVICPQGLERVVDEAGVTHYASSDQCGYVVGKLDGTTFRVSRGFAELDYGHQFYAPQLLNLSADTALLVGWMGLPDADDAPTLHHGWIHALTWPRLVWLEKGLLKQRPLVPAQSAREKQQHDRLHHIQLPGEENWQAVLYDETGCACFEASLDAGAGQLTLIRWDENAACDQRVIAVPESSQWQLTADGCAIEIWNAAGTICASSMAYSPTVTPWAGWQLAE